MDTHPQVNKDGIVRNVKEAILSTDLINLKVTNTLYIFLIGYLMV